jgi:acyl-CoA reductase-like NAD-dependent aldehyde dehydrogenase
MPTKMMIAGEWHDSSSGREKEVQNPATGEVVDTVVEATKSDLVGAIDAAERAFGAWAAMPPPRRAEIVDRGARLIKEREKDLATLLTREQGKTIREAMLEIRRFVHTLDHYTGMAKSIRGGYVPLLNDRSYGMIIKKPIGIVGSIVPWNFPVALMGNKIGPALIAGDTIVVKPAGTTPLTATACVGILNEAGLPPGVLNIVPGPGSVVGEELLRDPRVRKIGFTGATDTGRHVMQVAGETIKRVTLELGGSDPMIVCDDADIDAAVSAASVGRFFNCGQACLAIKRLYLFESIHDEFVEKLAGKIARLRVGNGLEKGVFVGPLHTAAQRAEVEGQVQDAVDRGATIVAGGKRPEGDAYASGHFYMPTLLTNVDEQSRVVQEEVFGPALPVMKVGSLDEGIDKANASIFGLGSSVWTRDLDRANVAVDRLEAGYTWVNSPQIIFDELPFGGVKQSGLGKEHGSEAFDYYMETKSVVIARNTTG